VSEIPLRLRKRYEIRILKENNIDPTILLTEKIRTTRYQVF